MTNIVSEPTDKRYFSEISPKFFDISILGLKYETSIPRKYFSLPSSLISNSLIKYCFRFCFSFSSFPLIIISSTYTRRAVTLLVTNFDAKSMIFLALSIPCCFCHSSKSLKPSSRQLFQSM